MQNYSWGKDPHAGQWALGLPRAKGQASDSFSGHQRFHETSSQKIQNRGKAITCTGLRVLGRIRKRSSYDKSRDSRRTDAIVLRVHGVMLYSVYCFSRDVLLKTKRYLANSIMDNFCFQCTVIFEHPVPTASNSTNREN